MKILWIAISAVGVLLILWAIAKYVPTLRTEPELADVPAGPMEKLARLALFISGAVGLGLFGLVVSVGPIAFEQSAELRGIFSVAILVGVGAWFAAWFLVRRRSGGIAIDERDRSILAGSLAIESGVVLLSVLVWTITLTEAFWNEKSVPLEYIQLLFWSTFILSVFGRSLGIILGYRRSEVDA